MALQGQLEALAAAVRDKFNTETPWVPTVKRLAADDPISTIALAKTTGLDQAVGVGTWHFKYLIMHQAAAATTGLRLAVNHSGTVTRFLWNTMFAGLIGTASDANPDQDSILAAATVMNMFSSRAKSTTTRGTTLSVDTANADMLTVIEGICIVTVAGNLELWHGSEVAAATTILAGSSLILQKLG